jgi:hypothetical protein
LLNLVRDGLEKEGFVVYFHKQVPTNDGGLALGQAVIANVIASREPQMASAAKQSPTSREIASG